MTNDSANASEIMVVDDDVDLAEALAAALSRQGYRVRVAHDGPAALQAMVERDFDIAFMDVRMPGMSGVECFEEIRRRKPDARVVMITGGDVEAAMRAKAMGALGILQKPFSVGAMVEMVKRAQAR